MKLLADENFDGRVVRAILRKVVVDDLLMLADASLADEWEGQVIYLPL